MSASRSRSIPPRKTSATLRGAGLRVTAARDRILRFLLRAGRPMAHAEIAGAEGLAALDRVTLYRTLAALQRAGLVHRVQDRDGFWRFCAHRRRDAGCPGNHPHFHCTRCGRMRCLRDQALPRVAVPGRARVTGKQLVVYGLCPGCARRRDGQSRRPALC